MESPARSVSRPHRKPLQRINSKLDPNSGNQMKQKPIQSPPLIKGESDKENRSIFSGSLAAELLAVRKRKERIRLERERSEEVLKEREIEIERGMREMERRGDELRRLAMEIQRLIRMKDLRSSCMRSSPFQSLRAKEEKMRREAQLQEPKSVEEEKSVDKAQNHPHPRKSK